MRATVEHIGIDEDLPPIKIKLVRGREDLSIKVIYRDIIKGKYAFVENILVILVIR